MTYVTNLISWLGLLSGLFVAALVVGAGLGQGFKFSKWLSTKKKEQDHDLPVL